MPYSTSSNPDPHSTPEQSADTPQYPIQPQNSYEWLTAPMLGLFQWFSLTMPRVLFATIIRALGGTVAMATQFQDAQNVNVSGNPTLMNIGTNTGNLTTVNNYGGTHELQGLETLKEFVSFAALHDSAEQDPDRRCHPGTRKTVLSRLQDWFDNPNPTDPIIWLHGPAGAGKSAIAQTIADEYKERGLAATFFFYRSDPSRNDGNRLFPTIAWQLAFSIPSAKGFIVDALDKTPHLPTQAVERQFEQLVTHPFHNIASQMLQPAPVVIIDGVDECSDEKLQQRILAIIGNAVKNYHVPLRFLIVNRPEALIEEILNKFKDFIVSIDLAKLNDSNRDIQKYLEDKFSEIASNRGLNPAWPGQEIIGEVVSKSSGNFIFASLVIRFISDEDFDPEFLLDIVRNLTPRGDMSPFAILDELYLEILKRQRDQDFLKNFLVLLVAHSFIRQDDLHKDDAMLMNVSKKEGLHTKLRRMRSLLKFEPFIDVYHKSFLDFLQDPSRSGQYHVSKEGGLKQYLGLVVDSVVRHMSLAIEQPNCHETCHFSPAFKWIVNEYPPKIVLPVDDWQVALKPLLDLQDKLLTTSKPKPCHVTQVMRDLLHLVVLQEKSHHIAATHVPESNMNETVTGWISVPVTEATQNIPETDLDSCLSALLSCLQKTNSLMMVDSAIIDYMSSLLAFDYAETAARVRSVSDAQKLIDLIDLLNNNKSFLDQCGPDAARKAAHLASNIFARIPILPLSPFLNGPARRYALLGNTLELISQSLLISKILDHDYILPVLGTFDELNQFHGCFGNVNEQSKPIDKWLSSSFSTRIQIMLEIARSIRYIHSMDITLYSKNIDTAEEYIFVDSNFRAKFMFRGLFAWWSIEASSYGYENEDLLTECTYEANISAFARLFDKVCFDGHNQIAPKRLVDDARQLIERCRTKDLKRRPTMEDVVKEMETWNLT